MGAITTKDYARIANRVYKVDEGGHVVPGFEAALRGQCLRSEPGSLECSPGHTL